VHERRKTAQASEIPRCKTLPWYLSHSDRPLVAAACEEYANCVYMAMWSSGQISIVIDEVDLPTVLASITTPIGVIELIGDIRFVGRALHIQRAHIGGLTANAIGIPGLNAIGRKLMEEAGVTEIVIEGSARTTGRCKGRTPRPFRFPRGGGKD